MEIKLSPYMIFGLVAIKYNRLPTNFLHKDGSTIGPLSSLLNLVLVAMGLIVVLHFSILNLFRMSMAYLC